ncbi:MAG: dCTP deaminase [Patescibacteria group bacterium]|nr:dCTP deaminase [Patescibacteria group bacterium]
MTERPRYEDLVGILPDWAIIEAIKQEEIIIDPLSKEPLPLADLVGPVSIDFHLGANLKVFKRDGFDTIDTRFTSREKIEEMMTPYHLEVDQPFVLEAGDFVTATTLEKLTLSDRIMGILDGKSSLARLGVLVHSTAGRFDPGFTGFPVMEIGTLLPHKRILLYRGGPICAFRFEKLASSVNRSYAAIANRSFQGGVVPEASNVARSGQVIHNLIDLSQSSPAENWEDSLLKEYNH